ncbi:MAG: hypothetical protein K0Q50_178 [Vampirovibrio sp.]|jgi:hypothetical protein|nr:hypothetical protein [Vampirovibrio sp.]
MRGQLKVKLLSGLLTVITLTTVTGLSQAARAEVSWADILKPIVSELVVPTVKKGIANWQAKKGNSMQSQTDDIADVINSEVVEVYADSTASATVVDPVSNEDWKLPEEPIN